MITSTANKQIKELTQLIKKSKARREERVFVVEGIRMFVEAPKEQVQAVYASESFLKDPEHMACLQGYDYEEVSDSVFASVSDTKTPQGILWCVCRNTARRRFFRRAEAFIWYLKISRILETSEPCSGPEREREFPALF